MAKEAGNGIRVIYVSNKDHGLPRGRAHGIELQHRCFRKAVLCFIASKALKSLCYSHKNVRMIGRGWVCSCIGEKYTNLNHCHNLYYIISIPVLTSFEP